MAIFDKNHGLTPFESVNFLVFFLTSCFLCRKHFLLSRIKRKRFFWSYFADKNRGGKCPFSRYSHGLTPLSLVIYVPPPGKHISLVIYVPPPGKHISLVICVPPSGKRISLVIYVPHLGNTYP